MWHACCLKWRSHQRPNLNVNGIVLNGRISEAQKLLDAPLQLGKYLNYKRRCSAKRHTYPTIVFWTICIIRARRDHLITLACHLLCSTNYSQEHRRSIKNIALLVKRCVLVSWKSILCPRRLYLTVKLTFLNPWKTCRTNQSRYIFESWDFCMISILKHERASKACWS